jgi:gamma-glutamylputrescine oxidase
MKEMSFPPSLSYWEIKEYFMDVDLLVVGSGIVGLTTAIFYKEKNPGSKILIVERGMLPSGASAKNAGFASFGSTSEILADLKKGDLMHSDLS